MIREATKWIIPSHLPFYFGYLIWDIDFDTFTANGQWDERTDCIVNLRSKIVSRKLAGETAERVTTEWYHWLYRAPPSIIQYWMNVLDEDWWTQQHSFGVGYQDKFGYVAWNAFIYQFYSSRWYVLLIVAMFLLLIV